MGGVGLGFDDEILYEFARGFVEQLGSDAGRAPSVVGLQGHGMGECACQRSEVGAAVFFHLFDCQ